MLEIFLRRSSDDLCWVTFAFVSLQSTSHLTCDINKAFFAQRSAAHWIFSLTYISFLLHSDAQFDLQQVVWIMSMCLNALSCCNVNGLNS